MAASDPTSATPPPERLTELETSWTMVLSAHKDGPAGREAMHTLISRYHDAVENYLRLKIRDRNLADEILQEFWSKLLNRKLAGADETKGRFRDYMRTVIHRLIIDHFRARKVQPLPPGDLLDPSVPDDEYDRVWRESVIKRVWNRLETFEAQTPKNRYATVLHMRVGEPKAQIDDLAAHLAERLGTRITPEGFRKTLQRARAKFLELLIAELRDTLNPATQADIEAEIYDLGLGPFYRKYAADHDEDGE